MKVRALDANGDYTFGSGLSNYISDIDAINQTVASRLKSFKNDNPLAMNENIDWSDLLGRKGTEDTILREIERVVLQTNGVTRITELEVKKAENRIQSLSLKYDTIYSSGESLELADI